MGRLTDNDAAAPPTAGTKRTKLDVILEQMDDDDRDLLTSWLHDTTVGCEDIELRLLAAEVDVSDSTIRRWRRLRRIGAD